MRPKKMLDQNERSDALRDPWPAFLDQIDDDPDEAFRGFYALASTLLSTCAPSVIRSLPADRRQDLLHDLVLHCCGDGFRILRRYRNHGRPFAAWLQLVARNRALDNWRAEKLRAARSIEPDSDDDREFQIPDPVSGADSRLAQRDILARVRESLDRLSVKCRLLVQGAADGLKPRELVSLMGWPADWNKKASDDLRECRRRLRQLLADGGVDPDEVLS